MVVRSWPRPGIRVPSTQKKIHKATHQHSILGLLPRHIAVVFLGTHCVVRLVAVFTLNASTLGLLAKIAPQLAKPLVTQQQRVEGGDEKMGGGWAE